MCRRLRTRRKRACYDRCGAANARRGGRGIAVDLTLTDASGGIEMTMGTGFDDFTALSAHETLDGFAPEAIRNRALLLGIMTATGWDHYGPEWWHYHLPGREAVAASSAADVPGGPM